RAACIRTGWKDRNRCTACRNEARIRISHISQELRRLREAECRIENSARPCGLPPSAVDADRRYLSSPVDLRTYRPTFAACHRCPGIRVAGICDRTKLISFFPG